MGFSRLLSTLYHGQVLYAARSTFIVKKELGILKKAKLVVNFQFGFFTNLLSIPLEAVSDRSTCHSLADRRVEVDDKRVRMLYVYPVSLAAIRQCHRDVISLSRNGSEVTDFQFFDVS